MARDWENTLTSWAQSPSNSEQERSERVIRAIRTAISSSPKLQAKKTLAFVQGSFRNRVNVRRESDVDVGVMLYEYFLAQYSSGRANADFGNSDANYPFSQFKDELEEALVAYFGRAAVKRGNKAFDIKQTLSKLQMHLMTPESESWLVADHVRPSPSGHGFQVIGVYTNEPNVHLRDERISEMHQGAIIVETHGPSLQPTTLAAKYWTDRKTTGTMEFTARIDELCTRFVDAQRAVSAHEAHNA